MKYTPRSRSNKLNYFSNKNDVRKLAKKLQVFTFSNDKIIALAVLVKVNSKLQVTQHKKKANRLNIFFLPQLFYNP